MRLLAIARTHTGRTKHYLGTLENGEPFNGEELPRTTKLEIVERNGVYFLMRLSRENEFAGDTAHETLTGAMRQARSEFGVDESDWCVAES